MNRLVKWCEFKGRERWTMTKNDIANPQPLLAGKRGLVMGVANDRSIAWGIARVLAGHGAKLAFTYQGDAFGRRAIPLAKSVNSEIIESCDVSDLASVDSCLLYTSPSPRD